MRSAAGGGAEEDKMLLCRVFGNLEHSVAVLGWKTVAGEEWRLWKNPSNPGLKPPG